MRFHPALRVVLLVVFAVVFSVPLIRPLRVFAQLNASASANVAQWAFDPETTEVGKNADRARQLLWWVFSHPAIHRAPIIAQMWAVSRNIVYVFIVLVIVAFGLSLILSRRRGDIGPIFSGISSPIFGVNIPSIFLKIASYLLFVTFSYVVILGLIQFSDVTMRFFIENVGGKDLFNVIFAGAGNSEANYVSFVGYKDVNPAQIEMVNTSLFLVRMTSMTYFSMAVIIILRTIILWFLLFISPFLALLLPFVFIRNTGWIWIGVFFQWLFYGPMMALFLATLTRIWVAGIPWPFDFSRVNTPGGQIYRTSINILYGGPAQTLSPGNSANYVDTYAEYVIALIMLWAAILLPWLLLRIFRDYCCAGIAAAGATLATIFDRMRQFPVPPAPGPTLPSGATVRAVDLPFRQRIEEKVREVTRTSVSQMQKTRIEDIKEVSRTSTSEIARAMNVSVNRLADISRMELNNVERTSVQENLRNVAAPERVATPTERAHYTTIKNELSARAAAGDRTAATILKAADNRVEELVKEVAEVSGRRAVAAPMFAQSMFAPSTEVSRKEYFKEISREVIRDINVKEVAPKVAVTVNVPEQTVRQVLQQLSASQVYSPTYEQSVAKQTNLTTSQVQKIVSSAVAETQSQSQMQFTNNIAKEVMMPENTVKAVIERIQMTAPVQESNISTIAQELSLDESQVNRIVNVAQKNYMQAATQSSARELSQTTGISETKVKEVLTTLSSSKEVTPSVVSRIAKETGVTESKVETIAERHKEVREALTAPVQITRTIAQTTGVTEAKVKEVIERISKEERVTAAVITNIAKETGISEDKVETIAARHKEVREALAAPIQISSTIAKTTGVSETKVKEVIERLSKEERVTAAVVTNIAKETGISEEKVQTISSKHKEFKESSAASPVVVAQIAKSSGVPETKVKEVLVSIPASGVVSAQTVTTVAKQTGISEAKVEAIANKRKEFKAVVPSGVVPAQPAPTVTLDDYEEVKQMWLNHYRSSPVPITETVKSRETWLNQEETKLQNIVDLLESPNPALKQKGLSQVAEILPFMLLGGFSDAEVATYVKAKLEASKAVASELEMEKKVAEKVKAKLEEEEESTMVTVAKKGEEKEVKTETLHEEKEIEKEKEKQTEDKGKQEDKKVEQTVENDNTSKEKSNPS